MLAVFPGAVHQFIVHSALPYSLVSLNKFTLWSTWYSHISSRGLDFSLVTQGRRQVGAWGCWSNPKISMWRV